MLCLKVLQNKMDRTKLNEEVRKYETWVEECKYRNPPMLNLFNLFGSGRPIHPIYDRTDLTGNEKDEIMLAYDWKKVGESFRPLVR